jgi:hypothetical protein
LKVVTCFVNYAVRKSVRHETSRQCHPTAEFINAASSGGFRACLLDNGMSMIGPLADCQLSISLQPDRKAAAVRAASAA